MFAFAEENDKEDSKTTKFSISLKEETDNYAIVVVKLEEGGFRNLDFALTTNKETISACEYFVDGDDIEAYAKEIKKSGEQFASAFNPQTIKGSFAMTKEFAVANGVIAEAKLIKINKDKITSEDVSLTITTIGSSVEDINATVDNYLAKPEKSESVTEKIEESTTENITKEEPTSKEESVTDEDKSTTEPSSENVSKPEPEDSTTSTKNDDSTTTTIRDSGVINGTSTTESDSVNPSTGDTANAVIAAIVVLALSAGAFMAFKKKVN